MVSVPEDGNVNPAGENGAGLDIDNNTFLDAPQARPGSTRGPVQDINMSDFELQTGEEPALGFEPLPLFEAAEGMTERLERIPDSNVTKEELQFFVEDEIPLQAGTLKNAVSNAAFLSDTDTVYLDINTDVTLGDVFQIYRHRKDLPHR